MFVEQQRRQQRGKKTLAIFNETALKFHDYAFVFGVDFFEARRFCAML